MKRNLITALLLMGLTTMNIYATKVYFGTNNGKGIYVSGFDSKTGRLTPPLLAVETSGCGFLTIHPNKNFLYSTGTSAFKINTAGTLSHLNTQSTEGGRSCHLSIDHKGKMVMSAYYGGGAVASFQVKKDGSLSAVKSFHQHKGSGEHPERQKKAYAHSIFANPANTHAYAADLGIDKIMIYKMDLESGSLIPDGEVLVPGGSMGPRHMKWSTDGSTLYLLNELDMSISLFKPGKKSGSLEFIKTESTLPVGTDKSRMTCAEIRIHPNGKYIYASNRDLEETGRDSITVFNCFEDGFKRIDTVPAEVWIPRNFNLDPTGTWLLAAGMKSNDIAIFGVNPETGKLTFTGNKIAIEGSPTCIEFLN